MVNGNMVGRISGSGFMASYASRSICSMAMGREDFMTGGGGRSMGATEADLSEVLRNARLTPNRFERMGKLGNVTNKMISKGAYSEAEDVALEFAVREYESKFNGDPAANNKYWQTLTGMATAFIRQAQFFSAMKVIELNVKFMRTYYNPEPNRVTYNLAANLDLYEMRNWYEVLMLLVREIGNICSKLKDPKVIFNRELEKAAEYLAIIAVIHLDNAMAATKRAFNAFVDGGLIENAIDFATSRQVTDHHFLYKDVINLINRQPDPSLFKERVASNLKNAGFRKSHIDSWLSGIK